VEEGPNRVLIAGTLQGDGRSASFKLENEEIIEYRVFVKADRVSPFDLAASWRAFQENRRLSTVRGVPDVSINSTPAMGAEVRCCYCLTASCKCCFVTMVLDACDYCLTIVLDDLSM